MSKIVGTGVAPRSLVLSHAVRALLCVPLTFVVTGAAIAEMCYQDDTGRIVKRRRPGYVEVPCPDENAPTRQPPATTAPSTAPAVTSPAGVPSVPEDTGRAPRRQVVTRELPTSVSPFPRPDIASYAEAVPVPDRWRIVEALGYKERWYDPYNRNVLKADRPVTGKWFFNLSMIADSVFEMREVPQPVGGVSTQSPGGNDVFGMTDQWVGNQSLTTEFVYYQGNTVFQPPDWEFRLTPVFNYNYTDLDTSQIVNADPRDGTTREDFHVGLQAAFVDKHLRNVSDQYDFDSFRIGIQPFSSDFRGFLFQDNQLGIRLFGTRDNNFWQYNIAAFRRVEKDTNSGLNDIEQSLRDDDIFVANLYRQDWPVKGFTSQVSLLYNRNREDDLHYNDNDFIERPASLGRETTRDYDVGYLGFNGDGHFGRMNLTASFYYALGEEDTGTFVNAKTDISAFFVATEWSMDFDWIRPRISLLYASGDDDPFDDQANGFDAVVENPQFAGADTSYFIRQAVPLIGGGRVQLSTRNGVLNSLRSSKEEGQSNFTNPGTMLAGVGVDMDVMPTLRVSFNANSLYFVETEVLEAIRQQGPIDKHVGYDLSASVVWRPMMTQNVVVRTSYAQLIPGDGFDALFQDDDAGYFLMNAIFTY